jgi:heme exporter protein D
MDENPSPAAEIGTKEPEPPGTEPADVWQEALRQLRQQMSADTFASLLRGSHLVEAANGTWKIAVRPHAVSWLANRANPLIKRTVSYLLGSEVSLEYVADEQPPASAPRPAAPGGTAPPGGPSRTRDPSQPARQPAPPSALACLLSFDPNSASGGGFWKMGHYANWFWAAFLGTVAWRVYELVVSEDKRPRKTLWTPPRRFSVSELARAVASGREGRPNREQIRGRYRRIAGQRVWRPGAFDRLTQEGVARIEWHAGDVHWRPWRPGGSCRPGRSGIRIVYRISVVATLPLLTPRQVARLPAENQVQHERYLANRAQDLVAWEQIALPTLAGLDPEAQKLGKQTQLVPGHPPLVPRRQ